MPRRRGIQPGQVAWSQSSRKLHGSTETVTRAVVARWQKIDPNINWKKKLSGEELIRYSRLDIDPDSFKLNGVAPDGGVILYECRERGTVPLFSIEAKEQQDRGNAIERWFKNYTALRIISPSMSYVTLCSGEGAHANGAICKTINHAALEYAVSCRATRVRRWNKLYYDGPSFFRRKEGFSARRVEVLVESLLAQKLQDVTRR